MVGQEFQAKAAGQRLHVVLHQQRPLHHHLPPHHHPRAQGANVRPAGWETPFYLCLLATQDTTGASTVHNQFFSFFGFVTIFVFPARWDGLPRWTAPPPAPPPSSQTKIETSLNSGLLSGDPSFSSILDHYSFVFSLFICFDVRKSPGLCSAVFPPSSPSPRSCSTLEGFTIQVLKPSKVKTRHNMTNQMTKKKHTDTLKDQLKRLAIPCENNGWHDITSLQRPCNEEWHLKIFFQSDLSCFSPCATSSLAWATYWGQNWSLIIHDLIKMKTDQWSYMHADRNENCL